MRRALISRLELKRFRRCSDVAIDLGPLTVMIGPNGTGKSTVLQAFEILGAAANGTLGRTLSGFGGAASLVSQMKPTERAFRPVGPETFSLGIAAPPPLSLGGSAPLRYEIEIGTSGPGYQIVREVLSQQQKKGAASPYYFLLAENGQVRYSDPNTRKLSKPDWEIDPTESGLSQTPKLLAQPEALRKQISSFACYRVIPSGLSAPVRRPQQLTNAVLPGPEGESLFSAINTLQQKHPDRFELLEDTLRAAFPGFEALRVPAVANGMLYVDWRTSDSVEPLQVHQLSDGTIRFLWLATLLCCPTLPPLVLLDEPEVSLHPKLLELLVALFREASRHTQLLVATHSDRMLRYLQPSEIIATGLGRDGSAIFQRADSLNLESWLAEYTLDEIRALGALDIDE
jgi:predicted ATPase